MSPHIESLRIRGFRSLADVTLSPNPGANVLIGANGSGKSNFVRFFEMLIALMWRRLGEFVAREGGAEDQLHRGGSKTRWVDAEIQVRTRKGRSDYRFCLFHNHLNRFVFHSEAYRHGLDDLDGEPPWHELEGGHEEALVPDVAMVADILERPAAIRYRK